MSTTALSERPDLWRVFRHRNYRIFFTGQAISLIGTWMQIVAQAWLITRLTGSPAMLGAVAFASQAPVFFLALLGGTLADRFERRRLLLLTNALAFIQAVTLAALTLTGAVEVWHVFVLAFGMGLLNALEIPTRQSYTVEMVGREDLRGAIALNSVMFNTARIAGPSIAGLIVALAGEGACFAINAVSFAAVMTSLLLQRVAPRAPQARQSTLSGIKAGFAYVSRTREIRALLSVVAICAFAGAPYMSLMPLFARDVLGAGAQGYGLLMSAVGGGALLGALALARLRQARLPRVPAYAALAFGVVLLLLSQTSSFAIVMFLLPPTAFSLMLLAGSANTLLQFMTADAMRGRVMAFFTMSFMGMLPFGSLAGGWLASHIGVAATVGVGGLVCLAAAAMAFRQRPVALEGSPPDVSKRPPDDPVPPD